MADIAGLAKTDGNIIVGNGSNWVAESGATARASLGITEQGKNILINGAMTVAQRGSQSSVASGYGACDRWEMNALGGASARYTLSQESSGGVGGNAKWAKVLVTTADASPGSNEAHYFGQKIEGFNAQSLLDDSGDLLASTMSFDVIVHADGASSISFPATLAICVNDNGFANQQYVKTFTVAAADTWERVSVPIAANTSIVINNDNTNEFQVAFTIYSGTGKETTDATWGSAAGLDVSVSGVANLADATNNYLGITNVQLEAGSVATDFENEDYGTTLAKCQHYFERISGRDTYQLAAVGYAFSTTQGEFVPPWLVEKRASPTISYSGNIYLRGDSGGTTYAATNVVAAFSTRDHSSLTVTVASGLTIGRCYLLQTGNTTSDYFQADAEL